MTRLLLDTHTLLWFIYDDPRLSDRAAQAISDPDTVKIVSVVSLWEIVIKLNIGKLRLGQPFDDFAEQHVIGRAIELIDIHLPHLSRYLELPMHHRDPFDRLLIAQAQHEELTVVTADPHFAAYSISTLW